MHIVSIHAHPDDAEILCAGTLALLAQAGHQITIVTMTPGDKGSDTLDPEAIAAVRRVESLTAAALIGAESVCAEFRDLEIFNNHESRQRVVELVRSLRPEIVLTSAPSDYLADHEVTSALVRDSLFAASAPNYHTAGHTASPPLPAIPHLYFMDPIEGVDREGHRVHPEFYVDVTSVFEVKKAMLAAHASQREWLYRLHGIDDYLTTMEAWSTYRGHEIGVLHAEGFRQYTGHPYPRTRLLQELLGGFVKSSSEA
jgi:LmbE family N-acetylglucosaminyl deacetylase